MSIVVSFLSLVFASSKLFYSQRLGIFLEVDPPLKMTLYAAPLIAFQILFPSFSLVLMAAYFREYVIVSIGIIMLAHAIVIKSPCLKLFKNIWDLYMVDYGYLEMKKNMQLADQEVFEMFLTSIFTAWIAPCTVWANNSQVTKYFLLISSFTTMICHGIGILSIYASVYFFLDMSQFENPPVSHCFRRDGNVSFV
jgi:hypothetical protein